MRYKGDLAFGNKRRRLLPFAVSWFWLFLPPPAVAYKDGPPR